jgi:murein L,D-transpeptidase YafK
MFRILLSIALLINVGGDFKITQKQSPRVKTAYINREASAERLFSSKGLNLHNSEIFFRVHKVEKELQLWARERGTKTYQLIRSYSVCSVSGEPGPKRMIGDLQTPEGFYYIDRFNPASSYHLSLGINYPNSCDKFNCNGKDPGGDIFIHGKCVTIGCLPMTDEQIEELYVIAVEAKAAGQNKIPVAIFPCKMNSAEYSALLKDEHYSKNHKFWANLKNGYDLFENEKVIPVYVQKEGYYSFTSGLK